MVSNGHWQKDINFIFEMDADFSHNPKDLARLYDACKKDGLMLPLVHGM